MAVDMFLKIDGIEGESTDDAHGGEIDVQDWTWSMVQSGSAHEGGGSGSGKVSVQDLVVRKRVDKASPILIKLCCSGKHFEKALLTVRKAGGQPIEYLKLEMTNGIITEVSPGGAASDDLISETIRMSFEEFTYTYTTQDAAGAGGGEIPASWNIAKNIEG